MSYRYLLIIISLILFLGCTSEEVQNNPEQEQNLPPEESEPDSESNSPPDIFDLKDVPNGSTGVRLRPLLSWDKATDPDNDSINYDILLDKDQNPSTVVISNIEDNVFEFVESLEPLTTYYWRVIAKDSSGNSTESQIFSFTTQDLYSIVTDAAEFEERVSHTSVVFKNQIWVIAGATTKQDGSGNLENDVWSSSNGVTWTKVNDDSQTFSPRAGHASVVFQNKLWVIGGNDGNKLNDVWSSEDGIIWTEVNSSAEFPIRQNHSIVEFDNKLWIFGGEEVSAFGPYGDIWNSSDGITWNQVENSNIPARSLNEAVVFNDKIWIIAGFDNDYSSNEVWNSSDGIVWNKVESTNVFNSRHFNTTVVFDEAIWVVGGINLTNNGLSTTVTRYNDIWKSADGINWNQVRSEAPFSKREYLTSVVFQDRIWIIGGFDGSSKNDVWTLY